MPPPTRSPPAEESKPKETDNFVFSEVSLKSFVNDVKTTDKITIDTEEVSRKEEEERKQKLEKAKEFAEAKKREMQEKRAAALAKERELEEKKAIAAAKQKELEERKAIAAAKQQELEEKKTAEEERKRRLEEEKRERDLQIAVAKKKAAEEKQRLRETNQAKPGATISLGLFGLGQASKSAMSSAAPQGVPTLSSWKQNRDGSVSGLISGSSSFRNGESITTSPIRGSVVGGSVVSTISGSK